MVEIDELQGIIAEAQERGFITATALAAALEEAELSAQQTHDLLSYLEEHGIEVLAAGEAVPELGSTPCRASHSRATRTPIGRRAAGRPVRNPTPESRCASCTCAWRSSSARRST